MPVVAVSGIVANLEEIFMRAKNWLSFLAVMAFSVADPTTADDLRGAERLLCTSVKAMECYADGACVAGEPEEWNIPRFLRVDLAAKTMSTTEASGENRATAIENFKRDGDRILIQGMDQGRAFSAVLNEVSGLASTGIALDGNVVSVFSHCTPEDWGE